MLFIIRITDELISNFNTPHNIYWKEWFYENRTGIGISGK
jgi:hypothetical protein